MSLEDAIELGISAERSRIRRLLSKPLLDALRCIPDGEIRDGCVVYDGATVRENARQAYLAIYPERNMS
jgi:hypothetical protein